MSQPMSPNPHRSPMATGEVGVTDQPEIYSSPWVGWIAFAGVIMVMLGTFHVVQGLVALFNSDYYLVRSSGLVINVDFTAWGWVQLIGGIITMVAGFGVFIGQVWARSVGVIVALGSALLNVGFLAAYPLWSLLMIALDVIVILALTVHGSDIKPYRGR
jgi:hypothetical protein